MKYNLHRKLKTTKATSKRMSHVHLKRDSIENIIALSLWHDGIRYRRNYKKLPGSPDVAITKYKIAVFADGEFWHGYHWEEKKKHLKRNRQYWIHKIESNMARDKRQTKWLQKHGWIVLRFWGRMIKKHPKYCVGIIEYYVRSRKDNS